MPNKKVSVWTTDDDVDVNEKQLVSSQPMKKVRWTPFWIGLAFGMLVAGIALSAILVMYIRDSQKTTSTTTTTSTSTTSTSSTTSSTTSTTTSTSTSTSTTSTTTTTSTTITVLPAQCYSYTTNIDPTRYYAYSIFVGCDSGLFGGGTWVRFLPPAGTHIPSAVPSTSFCGTHATGWYSGTYPSTAGSSVAGTVCYNWSGFSCNWSNAVTVTHCGSYFVYFLIDPPACSLRYCTA